MTHEGIEREGNILRYLNEKKVDRVPTLVCHGDVRARKGDVVAEDDLLEEGYDEGGEGEDEEEETDAEDEDAMGNDKGKPRGRVQQTVSQKYWTAHRLMRNAQ